ncbi:hypothetical protein TNCV_2227821 [Trichonephila clavipes]|nr:hypothetical protein TNCV_2227821 [Trichonephila clavipes]
MDAVEFLQHENPSTWAGVEHTNLGHKGQRQSTTPPSQDDKNNNKLRSFTNFLLKNEWYLLEVIPNQLVFRVKRAGRNMHKLAISEALEHMRQLSENEFENDNDEEIVFCDDEYVSVDEENISSDEDTVSNFPVQCTSRKIPF